VTDSPHSIHPEVPDLWAHPGAQLSRSVSLLSSSPGSADGWPPTSSAGRGHGAVLTVAPSASTAAETPAFLNELKLSRWQQALVMQILGSREPVKWLLRRIVTTTPHPLRTDAQEIPSVDRGLSGTFQVALQSVPFSSPALSPQPKQELPGDSMQLPTSPEPGRSPRLAMSPPGPRPSSAEEHCANRYLSLIRHL
jgi:hypothetical protein